MINLKYYDEDADVLLNLQAKINSGMDGADIMHGELKYLMHEAEQHLDMAIEREEKSGEAMDSMDRTYAEGYLDALTQLYKLTYEIAFAIGARNEATR
jgi:hypothetical protein